MTCPACGEPAEVRLRLKGQQATHAEVACLRHAGLGLAYLLTQAEFEGITVSVEPIPPK